MSMFDEITCEYSLPNIGVVDWIFQTKSLDCMMGMYRITAAGRLLHIGYNREFVPENERPHYGTEKWDSHPFVQGMGCIKSVPFASPVVMDYQGDLYFYDRRDGKRYEYVARFTEGILIAAGIRLENEK